jgi:hypothetical protein
MTDSRAAVGLDRLPWLSDEAKPRAKQSGRDLLGWAVAATLLVAGASYWLGLNSAEPSRSPGSGAEVAQETVALPEPRPAEPAQPIVEPAPAPEVTPIVAPPMPVIDRPAPRAKRAKAKHRVHSVKRSRAPAARKTVRRKARAATAKADPHRPWPVRVESGASGRLVRIGTFTSSRQAKKGWWAIMRVNPSLKRLPALVVPVQSQRTGRTFYRLQMGTTSQAHSEVLCQRMRMIGQSCVVIRLNDRGTGKAGT